MQAGWRHAPDTSGPVSLPTSTKVHVPSTLAEDEARCRSVSNNRLHVYGQPPEIKQHSDGRVRSFSEKPREAGTDFVPPDEAAGTIRFWQLNSTRNHPNNCHIDHMVYMIYIISEHSISISRLGNPCRTTVTGSNELECAMKEHMWATLPASMNRR